MTPDKPFFIYYAAPGTHAPSQVPKEWRDKYKGKFDEGWDKYREQILVRQKALGIVPPNTQLTPKPPEMQDWDKLTANQKKVLIRQQEVFAAYGVVIHWPKVIKKKGEVRPQYHHLIDIAPTVLEAARLPQPKVVNGTAQTPIEGVSMVYRFTDARAKSPHTLQYAEFMGNRGIYKDGWYATTVHKAPWDAQPRSSFDQDKRELYNTADDFSCANDIASKHPDKLKELQGTFLMEAVRYNVLPLDDRIYERFNSAVAGRPDLFAGRTSLAVYEGMVGMKENAFINTKNHSYSVTADLDVPHIGDSGVILAQGGLHAGWSLYVKDSMPKYAYNYLGAVTTVASQQRLPPVRVTIRYEFAYDGGKPGSGGTGAIFINGKKVASGRIEHTIPFLFGVETADVGMDLYTAGTPDYRRGASKDTGKINKITVELKKMSAANEEAAKKATSEAVKFAVDQK